MKSKHINVLWRAMNRSLSVSPLSPYVSFPLLYTLPHRFTHHPHWSVLIVRHFYGCCWTVLPVLSLYRKKGPAVLVSGLGRSSTDEVLSLSRDNRPRALQQRKARPKHKAVIKEGPLLVSSTKWGQNCNAFSTCVQSKGFWHGIVYYSSRQTWWVKRKTQRHSATSRSICRT